jgi:hypothetical protein
MPRAFHLQRMLVGVIAVDSKHQPSAEDRTDGGLVSRVDGWSMCRV